MKIAYYISDYGYGHATRCIALIRRLMLENPKVQITICHSFAVELLKKSLTGFNVKFRHIETDIGYFTKEGAIDIAPSLMKSKYKKWIATKDQWVFEETLFLKSEEIDLVITDISPFAIDAAKKCNIKTVAISNFTWYSAYLEILSEGDLEPLFESYSKADYFFHLACSNEKNWGQHNLQYNFFSREVSRCEINKIRSEIDPLGNSFIIFLGLGMKLNNVNFSSFPIWSSENCKFIVSSNMNITHPNVYKIPLNYTESQNYIAASNLVISKAGWGTISEAVCNHVPVLLLERDMMNEDCNTIRFTKQNKFGSSIYLDELKKFEINSKVREECNHFDFTDWTNEVGKLATEITTFFISE